MGRGKKEIKKIEDTTSGSQNSFSRIHAGVLKKAHDLSVLCDAEVAVIIFSSTGQLYQFASSSMDQVLSRYNKCLGPSEASIAQTEAQKKSSDELAVLKEEVAQLMQRQTIFLGNDLTEYGLNELQQLEQLLNDGLISLRNKKEQLLMYPIEQSRMKENQIMLENERLWKQIEELKSYSYLPTIAQQVPYILENNQEEKNFPETHAALNHDKVYPCFQEKQIMPENLNLEKQENQIMLENNSLEKQFEELQSYLPTSEQPDSGFLEHSKEKRSFPETHSALGPDAVCKSGAENVGFCTTLLLGTSSRDQRKRKEPEQETAEKESFPEASEHQFDM